MESIVDKRKQQALFTLRMAASRHHGEAIPPEYIDGSVQDCGNSSGLHENI